MKKVKIYYPDIDNMGDELNKDLVEKCFDCIVERSSFYTADIVGIGSGLENFTYGKKVSSNIKKIIFGLIKPSINVWGTGFIKNENENLKFYKKKMKFYAVRGELTKSRVEKMIGKKLNIPTGDGGILASYFLDEMPEKKYEVGIIAHFREKENPVFKKLLNAFENSTYIDVQDTPENVTRKIAECKVILSSSLHGLIISDSLYIPNKHIVVTSNLLGDGYKFNDYYSAYGLEHEYIDLNKQEEITIKEVIDTYKITKEMVEKKKSEMFNAFPVKVSRKNSIC